jgi:methionyl aminopeptidase
MPVGRISAERSKLLERHPQGPRGRHRGGKAGQPGLGHRGRVEALALVHGYGVVRDFVGHGVGTALHEEPQIPNYGPAGTRRAS